MKTLVVKLGGFNFVTVQLPVVVLKNKRLFRRWWRSFMRSNPQLSGLKPVACQFAAGWGKPWHTTRLVSFL